MRFILLIFVCLGFLHVAFSSVLPPEQTALTPEAEETPQQRRLRERLNKKRQRMPQNKDPSEKFKTFEGVKAECERKYAEICRTLESSSSSMTSTSTSGSSSSMASTSTSGSSYSMSSTSTSGSSSSMTSTSSSGDCSSECCQNACKEYFPGRYSQPAERMLGRGGFGTVEQKLDLELSSVGSDKFVALKTVNMGSNGGGVGSNCPASESNMQLELGKRCPAIPHLFAFTSSPSGENVKTSMELIMCGDLSKEVTERKMPISTRVEVMRQLFFGLDCMHKNGIVHGDLKPENAMLKSCYEDRDDCSCYASDAQSSNLNALLVDFGEFRCYNDPTSTDSNAAAMEVDDDIVADMLHFCQFGVYVLVHFIYIYISIVNIKEQHSQVR